MWFTAMPILEMTQLQLKNPQRRQSQMTSPQPQWLKPQRSQPRRLKPQQDKLSGATVRQKLFSCAMRASSSAPQTTVSKSTTHFKVSFLSFLLHFRVWDCDGQELRRK